MLSSIKFRQERAKIYSYPLVKISFSFLDNNLIYPKIKKYSI